jgi:lipopolysaccharide/colanic/teichoic acid biosynthesis glycosyltransferase
MKAALLGILASVVAAEVYMWLPMLAKVLIRLNTRRLPEELHVRSEEEWTANLQDIPGNIAKLGVAADLAWAVPRLRHEHEFPAIPFKPATDAVLRFLDIILASSMLTVVAPLLGVVALVIKLGSPRGPILVFHSLAGRNGHFRRLKFRTIDDSRPNPARTLFGEYLHRFDIDELPTLWNVLRGDMSIVGPAPVTPQRLEQLNQRFPELAKQRAFVRPGITGPALLRGASESPDSPFAFFDPDTDWVENRGPAYYFLITWRTFLAAAENLINDAAKWVREQQK